MKKILLVLLLLIFNRGFGQVDNYDILTKNIESSNIKTITKYFESKKYPNGQKEFKIEFNKKGQLISIDEYRYPMGPDNPIIMRQEIKYDSIGRKSKIYIHAPDGSIAIDTFIYNEKGELLSKQRLVNKEIVKTWNYSSNKKIDKEQKEYDNKGNLIKLIKANGDSTVFEYDLLGNLIYETRFQDGKPHTKYTFEYNRKNQLINMKTYLLYIGDGKKEPIKYYFEYEELE